MTWQQDAAVIECDLGATVVPCNYVAVERHEAWPDIDMHGDTLYYVCDVCATWSRNHDKEHGDKALYLPLLQPSQLTDEQTVAIDVFFFAVARLLRPSADDVALLRAAAEAAYDPLADAQRRLQGRIGTIDADLAAGRIKLPRHEWRREYLGQWVDELADAATEGGDR